MNILLITSDYPPNALWGMGWHVVKLKESLENRGVSCYVATAYKSRNYGNNIITTDERTDRDLLSSNKYEIFNDFDKFNLWQEKLADAVLNSNIEFDLIHCHNWMSWITAQKIKKVKNIPIVITFHLLQKQYELMKENPIPTFH
ncbi:MAG TPA: glycosyltransferase, partial [Candidatus Dojkabacteria bacterium]|nr:glycosyltransferase [Candidatus Dojkabacteria bacterium]